MSFSVYLKAYISNRLSSQHLPIPSWEQIWKRRFERNKIGFFGHLSAQPEL